MLSRSYKLRFNVISSHCISHTQQTGRLRKLHLKFIHSLHSYIHSFITFITHSLHTFLIWLGRTELFALLYVFSKSRWISLHYAFLHDFKAIILSSGSLFCLLCGETSKSRYGKNARHFTKRLPTNIEAQLRTHSSVSQTTYSLNWSAMVLQFVGHTSHPLLPFISTPHP